MEWGASRGWPSPATRWELSPTARARETPPPRRIAVEVVALQTIRNGDLYCRQFNASAVGSGPGAGNGPMGGAPFAKRNVIK